MSGFTRRRGKAGAPLRGLFVDGIWQCDCTPRQPANHFEVKKPGPNQGKWFRTCQKQQSDKSRCKFFLWDSDAHSREAAALAHNSRTEPSVANPKTPSKRLVTPPPPDNIAQNNGESSRKRGRATSINLTDEYDFETSQDFRSELNHVMTAIETPRKAARTSEMATPLTRRALPHSEGNRATTNPNGLQTPETVRHVHVDPSFSGLSRSLFASSRPNRPPSPDETPTPNRFKDIGSPDLVHDVLALLRDARIRFSATTENDLHALVLKHTKTTEGLRRGRDVARSTIKARDAKIIELSYRISTLEAELEAEKAMVRHLQWELEDDNHADP